MNFARNFFVLVLPRPRSSFVPACSNSEMQFSMLNALPRLNAKSRTRTTTRTRTIWLRLRRFVIFLWRPVRGFSCLVLRIATIRSDFPLDHSGEQTARWGRFADQFSPQCQQLAVELPFYPNRALESLSS